MILYFHLDAFVNELNLLFQEFYHLNQLIRLKYDHVYILVQHDLGLNVLNEEIQQDDIEVQHISM